MNIRLYIQQQIHISISRPMACLQKLKGANIYNTGANNLFQTVLWLAPHEKLGRWLVSVFYILVEFSAATMHSRKAITNIIRICYSTEITRKFEPWFLNWKMKKISCFCFEVGPGVDALLYRLIICRLMKYRFTVNVNIKSK